jgi:hypothetical protein
MQATARQASGGRDIHDDEDDDTPGKAGEVDTALIGETAQMEGPSWMFALLGIFIAVVCSYLATRIRRRMLRFTEVDDVDSDGMEMQSIESIS